VDFTNEFRVPADVDTVFTTLIDLERVAPCMPGATLEEVDGDTYTGRMKVKVGPAQVIYRGTAEVTEVDHAAKRAAIRARGKETRGSGTASADVTATLAEDGGETVVTVESNINVTGKPAQFGRGVMADVGAKIIGQFADRLEAMLLEGEGEPQPAVGEAPPEPPSAPAVAAAGNGQRGVEAASSGPRRIAEDPSRADDALDLMEVAGAATLKRAVPLALVLVAIGLLIWWLRRR
jgi:uncharacterized protein